jgi:preprotein translocase subunit SecD
VAAPSQSRPGRILLALFALFAILLGSVALTARGDGGQWAPKLGLDLVGGTSISLEATGDGGAVTDQAITEAVGIIRKRVDSFGVAEAEVSKQGSGARQSILISMPGERNQAVLDRVQQTAQLNFRLVLQAASSTPPAPEASAPAATPAPSGSAKASSSSSAKASPSATVAPRSAPTTQGRALPQGLLRPPAADASPPPASASAEPPADPAATPDAGAAAGAPGSVEDLVSKAPADVQQKFATLDCTDPEARRGLTDDKDAYLATCAQDEADSTKFLLAPAALVGKDIQSADSGLATNAQGNPDPTGGWQVTLDFNGEGTRKWREFTALHSPPTVATGDQVAVVLDGKVVSAPSMNEPIPNGQTSITGSFTQTEARDLANVLKYGALPLTFKPGAVQEISPTLGSKQLRGGLIAGLLGLILVIVYSLLYYRGLGLVNVVSLLVSAVLTYLSIVLLSNTIGLRLSLAGVAGLVIGIGIAADSFIVYFERLRDEMREGKTMRVAVEVGWRRARRTIVAADFVSFLAAVVLYVLSVGAVKGFAVTLGLTTIIDIVVVFLFTKPIVTLLARSAFFSNGHPLSGLATSRIGGKAGDTPARGRGRRPGLATRARAAEQEA